MKQPAIIVVLLLIAANLFSQQTKKAETPKKSISYAIDTVTADTGFYLIEQIKEFSDGAVLPKITSNPYYYRDTTEFIGKIQELRNSAQFKLTEANKKLEEARQLNIESELRVRQAEILVSLLEVLREPVKTPEPVITPAPVIKQTKKKKTQKE